MIDQIGITLTGVTAIFLTQSKHERLRRFACLFGLAGQPFWFYAAITTKQWGVTLVCALYTLAWMKGVWQHWIWPVAPNINPLSRSAYAMSESKSKRLVIGFETVDDLHEAHEHVAQLAKAEQTS